MYTFVALTGISIIYYSTTCYYWLLCLEAPDLTSVSINRINYTTSDHHHIATTENQVDIKENAETVNTEIPLEVLQNPIEKKPEPVYQKTGEVAANTNVGEKSVDIATYPPQESENSTTEIPVENTVIEEPSTTVVTENQSSQVNYQQYDIPYIVSTKYLNY